eukprot:5887903-Prymnesium_polylepis.1
MPHALRTAPLRVGWLWSLTGAPSVRGAPPLAAPPSGGGAAEVEGAPGGGGASGTQAEGRRGAADAAQGAAVEAGGPPARTP